MTDPQTPASPTVSDQAQAAPIHQNQPTHKTPIQKKPARKKPVRKKKKSWLWPVLALLLIGGIAAYALAPKTPPTPPVSVVEAQQGTLVKTVSGTGTAKAEVSGGLSFKQGGTLTEVLVGVGDTVTAGQVLARLDTAQQQRDIEAAEGSVRNAKADVDRARAEISRAEASLAAARTEVDRAREAQAEASRANAKSETAARNALASAQAALKAAASKLAAQQQLFSVGAISRSELTAAEIEQGDAARRVESAQADLAYASSPVSSAGVSSAQAGVTQAESGVQQARAGLTQAQSNLEAARQKVQNLRDALADAELKATQSGVVSSIKAEVGAQVAAGSEVVQLTDPSQIYLEVGFDETRSPDLAVGQQAEVTFDALGKKTLAGSVTRIDPVAQSSGQVASVSTRIALPGAEAEAVRPGYTGTAVVTVREIEDAVLVPLETTREEGGVTTVWTVQIEKTGVEAEATAKQVEITVTERNANDAAVTGLGAGTRVITPYPTDLEEGQVVTVMPDEAEETAE